MKRLIAIAVSSMVYLVALATVAGAETYPPDTAGGGASPDAGGTGLAFTGSSGSTTLLVVALAAMVLGVVIMLVLRSRRHVTS